MEIGDIFLYIYYKYSTLQRGISINIAPICEKKVYCLAKIGHLVILLDVPRILLLPL